jgi:hypothetical protein
MGLLERINEHVKHLPEPQQVEVFDFVSFLESRHGGGAAGDEERDWKLFSSLQALDEDGEDDEYLIEDIKERYS